MLKTVIFAILIMLMIPVRAASRMSHDKFVQLDYQEQKKVVIAIMELVVAMEAKYKHETRKTGFNPERFQRYSEFMRRVSNLFFPEAHAADRTHGQYLGELKNILTQRNKCLYGGWISTMGPDNKCVHPYYSTEPRLRGFYQQQSDCGGRNQMTCNPAIFGFRNVYRRTLLCVPAGPDGADNTSRKCMLEALSDRTDANRSSKEERLRQLATSIKNNPDDSNAVFDFLLKACACEAKPDQISQHYHEYMRPHRTCLGILRMMSEVLSRSECSGNSNPMDANQMAFLERIKNLSQDQLSQENVESFYSPMVSGFVNQSEYQAICDTAPTGNTGTGGNDSDCVNGQKPDGSPCPTDDTLTVGNTPPTITTPPGTTSGGPTTGGPSTGGPSTGGSDGTSGGSTGGTTGGTPPGTTTCEGRMVDNVCKPFCPTGPAPASPAATVAAVTAPAATPAPAAAPVTPATPAPAATPADQQAADALATAETATPPANPATAATPSDCVCEDESKTPVNGICPETETPGGDNDDSSGPSFSVSITNQTNANVTIEAKVDPSDKKPEYTIIWSRSTAVSAAITSVASSRTTTSDSGSSVTLTRDADEPEEPTRDPINRSFGDGKTDLGDRLDGSWSITAPRMNQDYQVCGRFIKLSDNSTASDKCVTVKKQVAQPGGGANPFMGPQMPTRGGASDAIFRGVR